MFKKKDKAADAEKAPAPSKAKSKPAKSGKSGGGGAKEFFLKHTEKIAIGIVCLGTLYLAYEGLNLTGIPKDKNPGDLKSKAETTLRQAGEDHWLEIAKERADKVKPAEFVPLVLEANRPADPRVWPALPPKENVSKSGKEKRGDPALLAPLYLEGQSFYGAMAMAGRATSPDPLSNLKNAPPIKKREAAATTAPGYGTGGSGGSAGGPPGGSGSSDDEEEKKDENAARILARKYDLGYAARGGLAGAGGGSTGPYGGSGELGSSGSAGGMTRGSSGGGGGSAAQAKVDVAQAFVMNVVNAVVPHDELKTNYNKELANSQNYDLFRDSPYYLGFEVQRVEVTDDPNREIKEEEWKALDKASSKAILEQQKKWAGVAPEVVLQKYLDPSLSMPIPPVLIKDYRQFAKHRLTPTATEPATESTSDDDEAKDDSSTASSSGPGSGGYPGAGGSGMAGMGNLTGGGPGGGYPGAGGSSGGMPGGGYPGAGGSSGGMPGGGYPGAGGSSGGMPGGGYPGAGGSSGGMPGGGYPGAGGSSGGMPGGGYPGGAGQGFGGAATLRPAEVDKYRLVRFYDFEVTPGKVYRYRVRLLIEDPNYPAQAQLEPASPTLKPDVLVRIQELKAADRKASERKPVRSFTRKSDWSDASMPIRTAYPGDVLAGPIVGQSAAMTEVKIDNKRARKYESMSSGVPGSRVLTAYTEWDASRAAEVVRTDTAELGSVFSGKLSTANRRIYNTIVHPIKKSILTDPAYVFKPMTIIDLNHPENLSANVPNKDTLTTYTEVLAFDASTGQVVVSNEFTDFDLYRMNAFSDEHEVKSTETAASGRGPGGGAPGGGGGAGGGRGRGGRGGGGGGGGGDGGGSAGSN